MMEAKKQNLNEQDYCRGFVIDEMKIQVQCTMSSFIEKSITVTLMHVVFRCNSNFKNKQTIIVIVEQFRITVNIVK